MSKAHPVTYLVEFQQTYRTTPSKFFPEGHKKTVYRSKQVVAKNRNSAKTKAVRAIGKPGHFHDFKFTLVPNV